MLPDAIKDAPHGAPEVGSKGGSSEALKTFGIGITCRVVASLNATPERSKADLESVKTSNVRLVSDGFADLDGVTVCEVIVKNLGGTIT